NLFKFFNHLELPKIFPNELIYLLKFFNPLTYLSLILSHYGLFENNFKNLGKFLPKTLKRIQFREMDCSMISSISLSYFLEESILNGGCNLKYLEFTECEWFGKIYVDIAKKFGVELVKI